MIRLISAVFAVFFGMGLVAQAQVQDTYTVRGIAVDEFADSVLEAQTRAFASAKLIGARRMVARITLPEDRRNAEGLIIDQAMADAIAAAVDVEEETRGCRSIPGQSGRRFQSGRSSCHAERAGRTFHRFERANSFGGARRRIKHRV